MGRGVAPVSIERFTRLQRAVNGKAATVRSAILAKLHALRCCVDSVTCDNGSEFADHATIDLGLDAKAYFADPHNPWQRGTHENTNGLIRKYVPKGTSMAGLTEKQLQIIENKINDRQRKVLGLKTPTEVFLKSFKRRTSELNSPWSHLLQSVIPCSTDGTTTNNGFAGSATVGPTELRCQSGYPACGCQKLNPSGCAIPACGACVRRRRCPSRHHHGSNPSANKVSARITAAWASIWP